MALGLDPLVLMLIHPLIVSFGQGCEGEPLLMHAIIAQNLQLERGRLKDGVR